MSRTRAKWVLGVSLAGTACNSFDEVDTQSHAEPPVPEQVLPGDASLLPPAQDPRFTRPEPPGSGGCDVADGQTTTGPFAVYAVGSDDLPGSVIYSWTTAEQIAELRADPTLLTRSMTLDGQRGRAADWILERADSDEIAAILALPEYENKRFGWTNAWATLLGWDVESYGTELLAIRLREDAWIGRVNAQLGQWAFFDLSGNPVSLDAVKARPERIAAVYFIDSANGPLCGGTFGGYASFREIFVLNEGMIASWSAYTSEIAEELARSLSALQTLRSALATGECTAPQLEFECWRDQVVDVWAGTPMDLLDGYAASLAFPNPGYVPDLDNVDRLIRALEDVLFVPEPLIHEYPVERDGGP